MVWYAVSVGGRHAGYCRSDLITPHVKDYYVEWEGLIKTSTGSANLRTAASSSAAKVTGSPYANGTNVHVFGKTSGCLNVKNGTQMKVTGQVCGNDGDVWYKVTVNSADTGSESVIKKQRMSQ